MTALRYPQSKADAVGGCYALARMDRSSSEALLVLMKCSLVLFFGPAIGGLVASASGFPTGHRGLDILLVGSGLLLAVGALLYRGYRYQRRKYAIDKLQAVAAVA